MLKINNTKIKYNIGLLFIAIFALSIMLPKTTSASCNPFAGRFDSMNYGPDSSCSTDNTLYSNNLAYVGTVNPSPAIYLVNPNVVIKGSGATIVAITGNNFVPGAIAKWNGADRMTTYINSTRLEMRLNDFDLMNLGNFLITVYNPTPGGGLSNSAVLNMTNSVAISNIDTNTNTTKTNSVAAASKIKTNSNTSVATSVKKIIGNTSDTSLTASAILVSANFIPSNLIQWLIFFILILLIVFLWRKIYITAKDKEKPLKHA